jgi:hypothetical protein
MKENESKCNEVPEHEHSDLLAFALLAMILLFAARYIVYPDIVVCYIIPHISALP